MKILTDNADVQGIKEAHEYSSITGVTCNPAILKRTGENPYNVLREICELIGADGDLHVQVVSVKVKGMAAEAHKIQEMLGRNTYIEIPVVREDLKTMKLLYVENINVTGTAICDQAQGYFAGMAEAAYVAPCVDRIDDPGYNGVQVVKDIHDMLRHASLKAEAVAASFGSSQQILELAKHGLGTSTIAPDMIRGLIKADATVLAVGTFTRNFEELCDEDNAILNI